MTLKSLQKKLRTALVGTTLGLAGLGMTSTEGCNDVLDAAAVGFMVGQTVSNSGGWDLGPQGQGDWGPHDGHGDGFDFESHDSDGSGGDDSGVPLL